MNDFCSPLSLRSNGSFSEVVRLVGIRFEKLAIELELDNGTIEDNPLEVEGTKVDPMTGVSDPDWVESDEFNAFAENGNKFAAEDELEGKMLEEDWRFERVARLDNAGISVLCLWAATMGRVCCEWICCCWINEWKNEWTIKDLE